MRKEINHIYLDMDGVITDLDLNMVNEWKKDDKFQEHFTKFIKNKGFEKIGLKEDANIVLNYLMLSKVKVTILSSAGNPAGNLFKEVEKQKKKWLKQQQINFPAIIVKSKELKKKYAEKNALLIDDTLVNCTDFEDAGATSIHHTSALMTIQILNAGYTLEANNEK